MVGKTSPPLLVREYKNKIAYLISPDCSVNISTQSELADYIGISESSFRDYVRTTRKRQRNEDPNAFYIPVSSVQKLAKLSGVSVDDFCKSTEFEFQKLIIENSTPPYTPYSELLEELIETLCIKKKHTYLYGPSGVGKTTLISTFVEYARKAKYLDHCVFLEASTISNGIELTTRVFNSLKWKFKESLSDNTTEINRNSLLDVITNLFSEENPLLLVIDNLASSKSHLIKTVQQTFTDSYGAPLIILMTGHTKVDSNTFWHSCQMEPLKKNQTIDFLNRENFSEKSVNIASELIEKLGSTLLVARIVSELENLEQLTEDVNKENTRELFIALAKQWILNLVDLGVAKQDLSSIHYKGFGEIIDLSKTLWFDEQTLVELDLKDAFKILNDTGLIKPLELTKAKTIYRLHDFVIKNLITEISDTGRSEIDLHKTCLKHTERFTEIGGHTFTLVEAAIFHTGFLDQNQFVDIFETMAKQLSDEANASLLEELISTAELTPTTINSRQWIEFRKGCVLRLKGFKNEAIQHYESLLTQSIDDYKLECSILNNAGVSLIEAPSAEEDELLRNNLKARELLHKSQSIAESNSDLWFNCLAYNCLGITYQNLAPIQYRNGDKAGTYNSLNKAMAHYYHAAKITLLPFARFRRENGLTRKDAAIKFSQELFGKRLALIYAKCYQNIGAIYNEISMRDKARSSYNKALEVMKHLGAQSAEYSLLLIMIRQELLKPEDSKEILLSSAKYFESTGQVMKLHEALSLAMEIGLIGSSTKTTSFLNYLENLLRSDRP